MLLGINISTWCYKRYILSSSSSSSLWSLLLLLLGQSQAFPYESRKSFQSTIRYIYKTQGMSGFSRGIVPCAARSIPACAAMFTTVDLCRETLQNLFD